MYMWHVLIYNSNKNAFLQRVTPLKQQKCMIPMGFDD